MDQMDQRASAYGSKGGLLPGCGLLYGSPDSYTVRWDKEGNNFPWIFKNLTSLHLNIFRVSGEIEIQQTLMSRDL